MRHLSRTPESVPRRGYVSAGFPGVRIVGYADRGLISLGVAVAIGALGIVGAYPTYYASFLAMIIGPLLHIALTAATKGRYYEPAHAKHASGH